MHHNALIICRFHELDVDGTFRNVLSGTHIVEYPTLIVAMQHPDNASKYPIIAPTTESVDVTSKTTITTTTTTIAAKEDEAGVSSSDDDDDDDDDIAATNTATADAPTIDTFDSTDNTYSTRGHDEEAAAITTTTHTAITDSIDTATTDPVHGDPLTHSNADDIIDNDACNDHVEDGRGSDGDE